MVWGAIGAYMGGDVEIINRRLELEKQKQKAEIELFKKMTKEEIVDYKKEQAIERRHQELCSAARYSKPAPVIINQDSGTGLGGLLFGAAIMSGVCND